MTRSHPTLPTVLALGLCALAACNRAAPAPAGSPTPAPAAATEMPSETPSAVQRLDRNGNGTLEVAELPPRMQTRLGAADTDHDGVITPTELEAFRRQRRDERFARLDTDRDGVITPAEAGERWVLFVRADTDHDGRVTASEYAQLQALEAPGTRVTGSPAGMVARYDRNGDGNLQVRELPEELQGRLGAADTDHDGVLSAAELRAALPTDAATE